MGERAYYSYAVRARPTQHIKVSVRFSRDVALRLRQLARRRKSTVSDVIRSAISNLVQSEAEKPVRPYERIADLIGSVADLPDDLAATTGEQLADELVRGMARTREQTCGR